MCSKSEEICFAHSCFRVSHELRQTPDDKWITTLPEDIFILTENQLMVIRECFKFYPKQLVQTAGFIFDHLYEMQLEYRDKILTSFEACYMAANDFLRMGDKMEEIWSKYGELKCDRMSVLEDKVNLVLSLYVADAVYAAQKIHLYVFKDIEDAISEEMFGKIWIETPNSQIKVLVATLKDFLLEAKDRLDKILCRKTIDALASATSLFYVKHLLLKSKGRQHSIGQEQGLVRMLGDIQLMKDYFETLVHDHPSIMRVVEIKFEMLRRIHALLSLASQYFQSSGRDEREVFLLYLNDFVIFLQGQLKSLSLTAAVSGALVHLVAPSVAQEVIQFVEEKEDDLLAEAPNVDDVNDHSRLRQTVPGLQLNRELQKIMELPNAVLSHVYNSFSSFSMELPNAE